MSLDITKKDWSTPKLTLIGNESVQNGSSGAIYRGEFYINGSAPASCTVTCTGTANGNVSTVAPVTYSTGINNTVIYCGFGSATPTVPLCS